MNSRDYTVRALGIKTPAGRLAYDTVYGDFARLIKSREDFAFDTERMREELRSRIGLQIRAQAFLTVFDRYRAFLSFLAKQGTTKKLVNRLFACPPAGVILDPAWSSKFQCKRLICPWCRYRQVLELAKDPWAELNQEVYVYRRTYEAPNLRELNVVRKDIQHDRHLFLRKVDEPFIRFQRAGLEMKGGSCFFRILQMIVFERPVKKSKGWTDEVGTYAQVLELAFRYSAANLASDKDWDLLAELLGLNRVRRVELSRG